MPAGKPKDTQQVFALLPRPMRQRVEQIAAQEGRSMSAVIRRAVSRYLARRKGAGIEANGDGPRAADE